jgi:hypothetical protein
MENQDPQRGVVDFFNGEGDVQVVSVSTRDETPLYPGVRIFRTLALIRGCLLGVDRVVGAEPHVYDWVTYLRRPDATTASFTDLSKPWGDAHGYEHITDARVAAVDGPWSLTWRLGRRDAALARLTHLPVSPAHALVGTKEKPRGKTILLLRASGRAADWVTFVEVYREASGPRLTSLTRRPATIAGRPTDQAVGLEFELDGRRHTVVVNYGVDEVRCGALRTRERWCMR